MKCITIKSVEEIYRIEATSMKSLKLKLLETAIMEMVSDVPAEKEKQKNMF